MLTLLSLIGLVAYILIRPFDFIPGLQAIPFLYIFFWVAVLGFVMDLGRGKLVWRAGAHLPWAGALVGWALLTLMIRNPSALAANWQSLLISFGLYFLISHGIGDFRAFSKLATTFLACTVAVSAACVYQGLQPFQCLEYLLPLKRDAIPIAIGGGCQERRDCYPEVPDPEIDYRCEKVGLGGSTSTGNGRVRYVGVLSDPNESSMAASLGVPVAIGQYEQRRNLLRLLILLGTAILAATAVIMSGSRGGQLVLLTALGVYFVGRLGKKGVLVAGLLALPAVLYGGRGGEEADASSDARLDCLSAGIEMFKSSPVFGVGHGQFMEHHVQTAHNSYVLAAAELGIVGMVLWVMMVWISFRIVTTRARVVGEHSPAVRNWGRSLRAVILSFAIGIFFLTFNYHYLLWSVFGLAGAYDRVTGQQEESPRLRIGLLDIMAVVGASVAILGVILVYLRLNGR